MSQQAKLNLELLRYLKKQTGPVLPVEVGSQTGIGQTDLLFDLEQLMNEGYEVELHPYLGVRLIDIPDRLLAHEINDGLNTKVIGKRLWVYDACGSTNDEAWRHVQSGEAQDGDLFVAEHQTAGRGRMGRSWDSQAQVGLYMSFVSHLKLAPEKVPYLTSAVALGVANMIEQFVYLPVEIKWPNDILIGGRKVAGILIESKSNHPDTYVCGIGLNVNHSQSQIPDALRGAATSLRIERRSDQINRVRLLRPLIFYLDTIMAQLRKRKFDRIARAWRGFVDTSRRRVTVKAQGEEYAGILLGVDLEKGIEIELDDGTKRQFRTEHVLSMVTSTHPVAPSLRMPAVQEPNKD